MVARIWRGVTRTEDADTCLTYLQRTGLAAYRATPGNRAAFRAPAPGQRPHRVRAAHAVGVDSGDRGVRRPDFDRAVFYPDDDWFLVERGERVDHFDVVFASAMR